MKCEMCVSDQFHLKNMPYLPQDLATFCYITYNKNLCWGWKLFKKNKRRIKYFLCCLAAWKMELKGVRNIRPGKKSLVQSTAFLSTTSTSVSSCMYDIYILHSMDYTGCHGSLYCNLGCIITVIIGI